MKQSEIQIGGEYVTRVGDSLVRVRVTHSMSDAQSRRARLLYAVERVEPAPKGAHRRLTPRSAARLRPARIAATSGWTHPIGTPVFVRRDNGAVLHTRTRTMPWQLGHGSWVIGVEGISGGYALDRVGLAHAAEPAK